MTVDRLFWLVLFVFVVWQGFRIVKRLMQAATWGEDSAAWPATSGIVTHSGIARHSGEGGPTYTVEVEYDYEVNHVSYHGERVGFDLRLNHSQSAAKDFIAKYPVGSTVTVYYEPADPKVSTLMTGVSQSCLVKGCAFSLAVGLLGLVALSRLLQ